MQHEARQGSDGKLRNILFSEVSGLQLGTPQKSGGAAVQAAHASKQWVGKSQGGVSGALKPSKCKHPEAIWP